MLLCIFVKSKMISAAVADDVASLPACGTGARSNIMLSIYPNFPLFCRSARMTQKTFLSSRLTYLLVTNRATINTVDGAKSSGSEPPPRGEICV